MCNLSIKPYFFKELTSVKCLPVTQMGFSLIEALVAFMIISVGMLGIASLQTISMKAGHTAITRTEAILSAQNILDRMRANSTQIANYDNGVTPAGASNGCSDVEDYSSKAVTNAVVCTTAQLVADDVFNWRQSLAPNMAASTITVVAPVAPRVLNTVTITMSWTERAVADTALDTANNYTVTVEM